MILDVYLPSLQELFQLVDGCRTYYYSIFFNTWDVFERFPAESCFDISYNISNVFCTLKERVSEDSITIPGLVIRKSERRVPLARVNTGMM